MGPTPAGPNADFLFQELKERRGGKIDTGSNPIAQINLGKEESHARGSLEGRRTPEKRVADNKRRRCFDVRRKDTKGRRGTGLTDMPSGALLGPKSPAAKIRTSESIKDSQMFFTQRE